MLIRYLVMNRLKTNPLSSKGLKYLAKRVLLLKRLYTADRFIGRLRNKGAEIDPSSILNHCELEGRLSNLKVGKGSFVGKDTFIQLHAKVSIGDNVAINDSVKILTGSHDINSYDWNLLTAPISIGNYAWIATNSIILPGITIGEGAVVAAGSVVTKNVDPFTVVGGNPARLLKARNQTNYTYSPARSSAIIEAWMGK